MIFDECSSCSHKSRFPSLLLASLFVFLAVAAAQAQSKNQETFPTESFSEYSPEELNRIVSEIFDGRHINKVKKTAAGADFVKFYGAVPEKGILSKESDRTKSTKNVFLFELSANIKGTYYLFILTNNHGIIEQSEIYINIDGQLFDPNKDYFHAQRFSNSKNIILSIQKLEPVSELTPEFFEGRGFRIIHSESVHSPDELRRTIFVWPGFPRGSIPEILGLNFNPNTPPGFCMISPLPATEGGPTEYTGVHQCGFKWSMLFPTGR